MPLKLRETVAPAAEPVSLAEAKAHLRVDTDGEDTLIAGLIRAARELCESWTGRAFVSRTLELSLDAFPCDNAARIELPRPPLGAVTEVAYDDEEGEEQVLSGIQADYVAEPGYVALEDGESWPATAAGRINAVRITYTAGYGPAASVPEVLKLAVKLLVAHWYENREAVNVGNLTTELPLGIQRLIWSERITTFA